MRSGGDEITNRGDSVSYIMVTRRIMEIATRKQHSPTTFLSSFGPDFMLACCFLLLRIKSDLYVAFVSRRLEEIRSVFARRHSTSVPSGGTVCPTELGQEAGCRQLLCVCPKKKGV